MTQKEDGSTYYVPRYYTIPTHMLMERARRDNPNIKILSTEGEIWYTFASYEDGTDIDIVNTHLHTPYRYLYWLKQKAMERNTETHPKMRRLLVDNYLMILIISAVQMVSRFYTENTDEWTEINQCKLKDLVLNELIDACKYELIELEFERKPMNPDERKPLTGYYSYRYGAFVKYL